MANRAPTLDPLVHSISDLEKYGSASLPPAYRGKPQSPCLWFRELTLQTITMKVLWI